MLRGRYPFQTGCRGKLRLPATVNQEKFVVRFFQKEDGRRKSFSLPGYLDPEIMREAQKMMNDPAFQAQMKKVTESPAFKQHMQAQQEILKDPKKVKELEKKMQEKLKEGNELLEKTKAERDAKERVKKDDENENDVKSNQTEDEEEKKPAAKTEDEDEMPDIPNLNLN
ncbi:hypothetical protein IV203_027877 [Nitzschia inconspicua]|uniref:Uncharacterized protein n=1 Tax=Nitzschia inconspicua TaxID=303405 RepID=A0A9K3LZM1_9STRA|nr:hypothetical protein IV203_027877 [Nitzschia inconspicua]